MSGPIDFGLMRATDQKAAEPETADEKTSARNPVAGHLRRFAATVARFLRREPVLLVLGASVLAVIMTWPTLRHPMSTIPEDLSDPLLSTWWLSWPGHILTTDPSQLGQANSFYPDRDSFFFSDTYLGYAPLSFLGDSYGMALLRYNVLFVFAHALAFIGAYALARQLGSRWQGALLAGVVFAYAPWRLAQANHLNILSTGGMALALAALCRGHGYSFRHGFRRDKIRPWWAAAGWALATWQVTIGFSVSLHFGYILMLLCVMAIVGWLVAKRPTLPPGLWAANLFGVGTFLLVTYLLAQPLLQFAHRYTSVTRPPEELAFYSPPFRGFYTAPPTSWIWGDEHAGLRESMLDPNHFRNTAEMTVFPGLTLIVLAALGILFSSWNLRQRLGLVVGVVVTVVLGMSVTFADGAFYLWTQDFLPGWEGVRAPGRIVTWTTLFLALLAAGMLTKFAESFEAAKATQKPTKPPRREFSHAGRVVTLFLALPALLALTEGINTTPHPKVPTRPDAIAAAEGPMLVLPSDGVIDNKILFWTLGSYQKVANGSSGVFTENQTYIREAGELFPSLESITVLRSYGLRTVMVLKRDAKGTTYEPMLTASVDGLPVTRHETKDAVVFTLNPP